MRGRDGPGRGSGAGGGRALPNFSFFASSAPNATWNSFCELAIVAVISVYTCSPLNALEARYSPRWLLADIGAFALLFLPVVLACVLHR